MLLILYIFYSTVQMSLYNNLYRVTVQKHGIAIQCDVLPSIGSFVMFIYRFYRILETFNSNPLRYAGQHDTISTILYI